MVEKSSYVKDIEEYFLSLVGKGIMLSPKDYELISNWKTRQVPKEVVLTGIRNAFDERKLAEKDSTRLNLSTIAHFVEEVVDNHQVIKKAESELAIEPDEKNAVETIAERFVKVIASEKRETVRKLYINTRKKLLELCNAGEENVFKRLKEIEESFFEDFFDALPNAEREKILSEAALQVGKRARFMTEKARSESILSFRNEILKKEYNLKNVIGEN